jgi:hypothetical protein
VQGLAKGLSRLTNILPFRIMLRRVKAKYLASETKSSLLQATGRCPHPDCSDFITKYRPNELKTHIIAVHQEA